MFPEPVPALQTLQTYETVHDLPALRQRYGKALVELGSNENSLGPSPRVRAAMTEALTRTWRYPDPSAQALKQALAARFGHPPAGVVLGNGSHELLMQVARCFAGPGDEVLYSQFGFAVFPIAALAVGANPIAVPALGRDDPMPRGHDAVALAAWLARVVDHPLSTDANASTVAHAAPSVGLDTFATERDKKRGRQARVLYLANPNNPTGTWLPLAAVESLVHKAAGHTLVVVDEAYQEYVTADEPQSAVSLLDKYPHLLVTRTFSKAYGLAGLRIGYALCHPEVALVLEKCRETFNVNHVAQVAALAALGDETHVQRTRAHNALEREAMTQALEAMGLRVSPSQGNFLLIDFERDAGAVEAALLERAVVVRPMRGYGLPTCLRVTIGTAVENARFLEALRESLA